MEISELEKKLKKLPKASLSRSANFKFYSKFFILTKGRQFKYFYSSLTFKPMTKKFLIPLTVIILLLIGTTSYAYFSPKVTYGEALYPLKKTIEGIKAAQAKTPLARVIVYTNLAARRLEEAKILAKEQDKVPAPLSLIRAVKAAEVTTTPPSNPLAITVNEVIANTNQAIEASQEITNPTLTNQALNIIDQAQISQTRGLEEIAGKVGLLVEPTIVEAIAQALNQTTNNNEKVKQALNDVKIAIEKGDKEIKIKIEIAKEEKKLKKVEKEKTEDFEEVKIELTEKLGEIKDKITTIKEKFALAGISTKETQELITRLEEKTNQVEEAINAGNLSQAHGLILALDALTNNAKHFFKQTKEAKEALEKPIEKIEEENIEKGDKIFEEETNQELKKVEDEIANTQIEEISGSEKENNIKSKEENESPLPIKINERREGKNKEIED